MFLFINWYVQFKWAIELKEILKQICLKNNTKSSQVINKIYSYYFVLKKLRKNDIQN